MIGRFEAGARPRPDFVQVQLVVTPRITSSVTHVRSALGRFARAALPLLAVLTLPAPQAAAQQVSFGSDRIMRVNGQRVFPVGLLELGIDRYPTQWNAMIRESHANFVWDNGFAYSDSTPTCEAIRDSSLAAGYWLLVGSPDTWNWDNPSTPQLEIAKPMYAPDSLQAVRQCFPYWAKLVGYANRDEPVWVLQRGLGGDIDSLHVLETYTQIKTMSSSKAVGINFANTHLTGDYARWVADIRGYLPACDFVMSANYPYPAGPGTCTEYNVFGPTCSMDRLCLVADAYRNEIAPNKPLWMILQAHKGIPLKESRWEATQSIIHGATGLMWAGWTWYHALGDGLANWPITAQVIREYEALDEILWQSNVPGVVASVPDVNVLGKVDPSDEMMVFAAGRNGYTGSATITLPGVAGHWVEVRYENRYLPIVNRTITDTFHGYESHIYQVKSIGYEPPLDAPVTAGAGPGAMRLRVFPNPATGTVHAELTAPSVHGSAVSVHDVTGRRVGDAVVDSARPDAAAVTWDPRDATGERFSPGVYFLRAAGPAGSSASARVVLR